VASLHRPQIYWATSVGSRNWSLFVPQESFAPRRRGAESLSYKFVPLRELRASARNNPNPRTSAAFVLFPPRPVFRERAGVRVFRIFRITCDYPVAFLHRPRIHWPTSVGSRKWSLFVPQESFALRRRGAESLTYKFVPLRELRASARNHLNPRTPAAFVLFPPRPVFRERAGVRVFRIFRITCDYPVAFLHRPQIYWATSVGSRKRSLFVPTCTGRFRAEAQRRGVAELQICPPPRAPRLCAKQSLSAGFSS